MHKEKFSILKWEKDGETYLATIDMALKDFPEKAAYPYYVWMRVERAEDLDDAESERLNAVEDALESALRQNADVMFAGRITEPGKRAMMWYVTSSDGIAPLFEKINENVECVMEHDPEWELLAPFFKHDQA